jgi:hypothetical protein
MTASAAGGPTVTIDQSPSQADPTEQSPVEFAVVFSEPVTGFDDGDIQLSGTAGPGGLAVTEVDASHYSVSVVGMTQSGTVVATIPAGAAQAVSDGTPSEAPTSTDNVVTFQRAPFVTIDQAATQPDPTSNSPIEFTVVFDMPVTGFQASDLVLNGSAGTTATLVDAGDGQHFTVQLSGMTASGIVGAYVPAGVAFAVDGGGGNSSASTSDNSVTYNLPAGTAPTVTIDRATGQGDPTSTSPVQFDVQFSEPVAGFDESDVTVSGTAGADTAVVTGSGSTYAVAVSGMTQAGTVVASIPAGAATAVAPPSLASAASTSSDNLVNYVLGFPPGAVLEQAAAQDDPTSTSPIVFDVEFSEDVTDFHADDVVLSGTAGATTATITGPGPSYVISVSGMTQSGSVIVSIPAGAATAVAPPNLPSLEATSRDDHVDFVLTAVTSPPPSSSNPAAPSSNPATTPVTTSAPAQSSTTSAGAAADPGTSTADTAASDLATTGSDLGRPLLLGLLLALTGLGLVRLGRRRARGH